MGISAIYIKTAERKQLGGGNLQSDNTHASSSSENLLPYQPCCAMNFSVLSMPYHSAQLAGMQRSQQADTPL